MKVAPEDFKCKFCGHEWSAVEWKHKIAAGTVECPKCDAVGAVLKSTGKNKAIVSKIKANPSADLPPVRAIGVEIEKPKKTTASKPKKKKSE